MKKIISLFCDGSSLGNPGYGGYCGILQYKSKEGVIKERIIQGACLEVTNNQMELKAVIESLKVIKEPCIVHLVSDSSYVVKSINEWLESWVKRDFKKVKNKEMWQEYLELAKKHDVKAMWVRGHDGHYENERCDHIARGEALALKEKEA